MARILVSIVTENNLLNFLFIKQMAGKYDQLVFMITEKVKDKQDQQLADALGGWGEGTRSISLDGEKYKYNVERINEKLDTKPDDTYIVNLTGGTKAMSLAVHDALLTRDSKFFSVTQNKKEIYNYETGESEPLSVKITIEEYLSLYGLALVSKDEQKNDQMAKDIFKKLAKYSFSKGKYPLLKNWQSHPDKETRQYLGGTWFEHYSFLRIKDTLNLSDDEIVLCAKLAKKSDNSKDNCSEIDVLFIRGNELHTVECKVGLDSAEARDAMYKAVAITKYLGLRVSAYLFWLRNMNEVGKGAIEQLRSDVKLFSLRGIVTSNDLKDETNKTFLDNPEIR